MKPEKRLKDWAEEDREKFEMCYDGYSCSCFQSAPCGWCTHEGNPLNQVEDEDAWEFVDPIDELIEDALQRINNHITWSTLYYKEKISKDCHQAVCRILEI